MLDDTAEDSPIVCRDEYGNTMYWSKLRSGVLPHISTASEDVEMHSNEATEDVPELLNIRVEIPFTPARDGSTGPAGGGDRRVSTGAGHRSDTEFA